MNCCPGIINNKGFYSGTFGNHSLDCQTTIDWLDGKILSTVPGDKVIGWGERNVRKPYYEDDFVTIYHGDCRDWLPEADVVITDPPYGVGWEETGKARGGRIWGAIVGDDEPFDPAHLLALGKPTVLFGANHYASRLPDVPSWLVWIKRDGMKAWSQSDCELIWTNLGGPARAIRHDWWAGMTAVQQEGGRFHPTQKPAGLMRAIIAMAPEGVILDPYMGSGTTLVAAKSMGRKAIGIEIEERYCKIAAARCAQEVLGLEVAPMELGL